VPSHGLADSLDPERKFEAAISTPIAGVELGEKAAASPDGFTQHRRHRALLLPCD
jgi:hypothetical protein